MRISGHFKNFLLTTFIGIVVAIMSGLIFWGFYAPASFFSKTTQLLNGDQDFLKRSLGAKAYNNVEIFEFLDKASPSIAAIYKKKTASQVEDKIYLAKDRLGYGFVLTSDGWAVTNKNVIAGMASKLLAVSVKNSVYNVSSIVYDTWTDAVFIKLDAQNLAVASLGDSDAVRLGDVVFGGSNKNNFWFSYVSAIKVYPDFANKSAALISSENFGKVMELQDANLSRFNGGIAANKSGEIVGLAVSGKTGSYILPSNNFKDIISDLLKNKKIARPYFGVDYLDLSYAIGDSLPGDKGAYVSSVTADSPAFKAGLKAGDIVLSVDGENLNENKNLSEFISEYKSGDEMMVKISRAGKEMEVKATIGSE